MKEISTEKENPCTSILKLENNEYSMQNKNSQQEKPSNIDNMQRPSFDQEHSRENDGTENSKFKGKKSNRIHYYFMLVITNITLEPAEFLWGLGGNMGMASFSQLLVDKACNDRGYNETICDNVYDYDDIYKEVQKDVRILFIYLKLLIISFYIFLINFILLWERIYLFTSFTGCPVQCILHGYELCISLLDGVLLWCLV